jgi:DNA-binding response OmpR family regulator
LNAKEYLILKHLMENPNRVFTKKQLYHAVWDEDLYYDDNTIMVHISHIRNKIEKDPRDPEYLITIRGLGYKFQGR